MDLFAFWTAAILNVAVSVVLMRYYRNKLRRGVLIESRAKALFSYAAFASGLVAALTLFYVLVSLFDVPTGHGEILVSAAAFNVVLSLVLLVVGRIVVCWKVVQW